jgi:predicted PurR-regulated permease PerM
VAAPLLAPASAPPPPPRTTTARVVLRNVLVIVGVAITLYLVYLLRRPITWVLIAVFLAVALSAPVNRLNRHMRRGFAITLVYIGLLLIPIGIAAVVVPPFVNQVNSLVDDLPGYVADIQDFAQRNPTLRTLEQNYDIVGNLRQQAERLPARIGDAAGVLSDVGLGVVNSLFQLVTILVLTAFLLGSGRRWVDHALELQPPDRRESLRAAADHMAAAVGGYVGGALAQATVAAVSAYIVLSILGVPFAAPLAVIIFLTDLVPLVGATIGSVLVGIVTLFNDFPTDTIVWAVWSILYQQIENNFIQPQIQRRAVNVHPFVVLVAVLFGSTLLGVLGALLAIPVAASVQIAIREWFAWRHARVAAALMSGAPAAVISPPATPPPPAGTPPAQGPSG